MPLIRVQLSSSLTQPQQLALMQRLSATVARGLGKPEGYMMVVLEPSTPLLMGGKADPAALVEVRSVGNISAEQAAALSGAVSEVLAGATSVPESRIYLNFAGVPGSMWGHGSSTFG